MKKNPSESYRMDFLDMSKIPKKKKPVLTMKKYEIWVGWYHFGQGHHPPTEPEKIDEVEATSFKIACIIHEHQSQIDSLRKRMTEGDSYIEDIHLGHWYYEPKTNSNSWIGKYYKTREEALKSFS